MAAREAEPQALYDWMEVNLADVAGRHEAFIPDGKLCSAGRAKYAAFDTPDPQWPATPLAPGAQTFSYEATAPHATAYFRYYLSRQSYDTTTPLRWSDLELLYDSGPRTAAPTYQFSVDVPARTGRQVVYVVWQRSDSPEAFYGCSDVDFDGAAPGPTTSPSPSLSPAPTASSTPSPSTSPTASSSPEPHGGGEPTLTTQVTSDWGSGSCTDVGVTNPESHALLGWEAELPSPDTVTSGWNATLHRHGDATHARGEAWNADLAVGATTTFGFCSDRSSTTPAATPSASPSPTVTPTTAAPSPTPSVTAPASNGATTRTTVTSDWGSGSCRSVTVRNESTAPLSWQVSLALTGSLTSLWDAVGAQQGTLLRVGGASWNARLAPGASTAFGFCSST